MPYPPVTPAKATTGYPIFLGGTIVENSIVLDMGSTLPGFETNPWNFDKGLISTVFLALGGLYWKYEEIIDHYLRKPYIIICGIMIYVLLLHFYHRNIRVLISMGNINTLGVIVSIFGICIIVNLCKMITWRNKYTELLELIGKNTIGLYFVCGAIPKTLIILLSRFLNPGNAPYMLFGFSLSFILSSFAVWLLKRFAPFLFDLRAGMKKINK